MSVLDDEVRSLIARAGYGEEDSLDVNTISGMPLFRLAYVVEKICDIVKKSGVDPKIALPYPSEESGLVRANEFLDLLRSRIISPDGEICYEAWFYEQPSASMDQYMDHVLFALLENILGKVSDVSAD